MKIDVVSNMDCSDYQSGIVGVINFIRLLVSAILFIRPNRDLFYGERALRHVSSRCIVLGSSESDVQCLLSKAKCLLNRLRYAC